jgi:hypothetical protein
VCVVGTSCNAGVGGSGGTQTQVTPRGGATGQQTVGVGGKSTAQGGSVATGGSVAKGGTTARGGTTAAGGTTTATSYVDPNPTVCSDTSTTSVNLTTQFGKANIQTSTTSKSYAAMANWWGKFSGQSVALSGLGFTITNPGVSASGNDPIGFPTIFIGNYQTFSTVGSNLPKQVSALTTIPVVFNTNLSSIDGSNLNASLDVWFNTTATRLSETASKPTGGYLMVWQAKPSNRQPRGGVRMSGQTVGSVPGKWDVWADSECVSYVSTTTQSNLTFDLNDFIKHAVANGQVIQKGWYLAVVFGGFEVWSGGNGAKVSKFCAKVN